MTLSAGTGDIAPVIQLAVAPVFLLTAVGAMLGVHINRLARAVDRTRVIEERQARGEEDSVAPLLGELKVLQNRMRLIYLAITLEVVCALFVGLTIVTAFLDALVHINLSWLIALLFVAAMLSFIGSLVAFLREIFLAVWHARAAAVRCGASRADF